MKIQIVLVLIFFALNLVTSEGAETENVVYEYKKYESFDLGNLNVEGKIITPGDLTITERKRKKFYINMYEKNDFDQKVTKSMGGFLWK